MSLFAGLLFGLSIVIVVCLTIFCVLAVDARR